MAAIAVAASVFALMLVAFDHEIARAMTREPDGVRSFLHYATDAVLVRWYLYPSGALLLALCFVDLRALPRARRWRARMLAVDAAYLFASVALAGVITNILKVLFGRARPPFLDEYGHLGFSFLRFGWDYSSFPSGHATTAGAVAAVGMVFFPTIRPALLVIGLCFAASRFVVEAHFASDVVIGFTIGFLTATVVARWLALRGVAYGFRAGGRGLAGLVPVRRRSLR